MGSDPKKYHLGRNRGRFAGAIEGSMSRASRELERMKAGRRGLPIYDHEEGARGDVGLAATFTSNRLAAVIYY